MFYARRVALVFPAVTARLASHTPCVVQIGVSRGGDDSKRYTVI